MTIANYERGHIWDFFFDEHDVNFASRDGESRREMKQDEDPLIDHIKKEIS